MAFESAAGLVRLLLRQSDRHPIRSISAVDLAPYDPHLVRSLQRLGILLEREDLNDDGTSLFQVDGETMVVVDLITGECERRPDALEVQSFDLNMTALCRALRDHSALKGPGPSALSARVWRLGQQKRQERSAEVCLVRRLREETAQEIVDHVRGAIDGGTPVILVSLGKCELPTAVARQLDGLCMTIAHAEDLLREDPDRPFALDLGRIRVPTGPHAQDARLQIDRIGQRVVFDGVELAIEPRDFGVLCLFAEEALVGQGWVRSDAIAATLRDGTKRDSNPEQVDRCVHRLRDAFRKHSGLTAVPDNGFIERKSRVGARLRMEPDEIALVG
ncbi:hypothetical protein [Pannonibacter sp.]|uniref:hypothetical protein n=1 Tax=Pannonibacter sp. TaxID=1906786 RepID=UPI003F6FFEFA